MIIKVKFILDYYKFIGKHELLLDVKNNSTLLDIIDYINNNIKNGFKEKIINGNEIKYPNMILINGRRAEFLNGLNTSLNENDEILFSPLAYFAL
ncbi:ubiquitin-like protein [Caldisphaera lagunensis DSM 15908]|uniref:Ubiquitin-like protein n=1 Tax=Caldisphaera lagunensis (strain DSM 15908 / JCM 11604 / ANMR 0165 / IC-154) TaxID=1056495 RepID=L0A884_CALLD|nr:MoaD/ThiS family protein [Caldisphaera lagunensis]AFZ70046.1 ubiquitin-like protein [Caldisphaera lagunensis DSM 15908]